MTASIVPGAISWPASISSDELAHDGRRAAHGLGVAVEREDVAAQEDVAAEVALERRAGPRPREPASSAATSLSSSICRRIAAERLAHRARTLACRRRGRRPSASRPSSPCPCPSGRSRPSRRPPSATIAVQLVVGQLGGQVGGDQLRLALLLRRPARRARRRGTARRRRGGACARGAARRPRRPSPSLAAFCSSDSTRRSAPTRSFSPAFMAPVRSLFTCSAALTRSRIRPRPGGRARRSGRRPRACRPRCARAASPGR